MLELSIGLLTFMPCRETMDLRVEVEQYKALAEARGARVAELESVFRELAGMGTEAAAAVVLAHGGCQHGCRVATGKAWAKQTATWAAHTQYD